MSDHQSRTASDELYDHEREEPRSGRRRRPVADWGVGEDMFEHMPRNRFSRAAEGPPRDRRFSRAAEADRRADGERPARADEPEALGDGLDRGDERAARGVDREARGVDREARGVDREVRGVDREARGVDREVRGVDREVRGVDRAVRGVDGEARESKGRTPRAWALSPARDAATKAHPRGRPGDDREARDETARDEVARRELAEEWSARDDSLRGARDEPRRWTGPDRDDADADDLPAAPRRRSSASPSEDVPRGRVDDGRRTIVIGKAEDVPSEIAAITADRDIGEEPAAETAPPSGRRTVRIGGRPEGSLEAARFHRDRSRRRPPRRAHERLGARPDRIAMWAFALGLLLILIAILSAH